MYERRAMVTQTTTRTHTEMSDPEAMLENPLSTPAQVDAANRAIGTRDRNETWDVCSNCDEYYELDQPGACNSVCSDDCRYENLFMQNDRPSRPLNSRSSDFDDYA
jgi:hypothetical protein